MKSRLTAFAVVLLAMTTAFDPQTGNAQDRSRTFRFNFEQQVPARSPFGSRGKSRLSENLYLPAPWTIDRGFEEPQGAKVTSENLEKMDLGFRNFGAINNGVLLDWEVLNGHAIPVVGRTAFMSIELRGTGPVLPILSQRYQALRSRLFDEFYFSGLLAEARWKQDGQEVVKFADQTVYMGQLLAVLATEMAILRASGQPADDARTKLLEILDAFDQLDLDADVRYGSASPTLDGFFLRDNVIGESDPRLGGRFGVVESDFKSGPDVESDTPSGDQIMGILFGLWFVQRESGDADLQRRAQATAARIYDYAMRTNFVLTRPDGNEIRRGSQFWWLSSLAHGVAKAISGQDHFERTQISVLGLKTGLHPIASIWNNQDTRAAIDTFVDGAWAPHELLWLGNTVRLKSFSLHWILLMTAMDGQWSEVRYEDLAMRAHHEVASLVRCLKTGGGQVPARLTHNRIESILAACPEPGPAEGNASETGWNHDNRWVRCTNLNKATDGTHEYNGVDWLLLHNLGQLVFLR